MCVRETPLRSEEGVLPVGEDLWSRRPCAWSSVPVLGWTPGDAPVPPWSSRGRLHVNGVRLRVTQTPPPAHCPPSLGCP